jgi:hypothetical protein
MSTSYQYRIHTPIIPASYRYHSALIPCWHWCHTGISPVSYRDLHCRTSPPIEARRERWSWSGSARQKDLPWSPIRGSSDGCGSRARILESGHPRPASYAFPVVSFQSLVCFCSAFCAPWSFAGAVPAPRSPASASRSKRVGEAPRFSNQIAHPPPPSEPARAHWC